MSYPSRVFYRQISAHSSLKYSSIRNLARPKRRKDIKRFALRQVRITYFTLIYHHIMTNICFLIFAQIRAKFRLFLLCWSVFCFQFIRSILGEQVSLNKNFCSALACISVLIFDNFFIFLTNFFTSTRRFFLSCR